MSKLLNYIFHANVYGENEQINNQLCLSCFIERCSTVYKCESCDKAFTQRCPSSLIVARCTECSLASSSNSDERRCTSAKTVVTPRTMQKTSTAISRITIQTACTVKKFP